MNNDKRALNFAEGCKFLGLKPSYVYKLTSGGILPYSKPNGKVIYFDREKLEKWMLSNDRPSNKEREERAATYVATIQQPKRKGGVK